MAPTLDIKPKMLTKLVDVVDVVVEAGWPLERGHKREPLLGPFIVHFPSLVISSVD